MNVPTCTPQLRRAHWFRIVGCACALAGLFAAAGPKLLW